MIVVLCNTYQDAKDAYDIFVSCLEEFQPLSILEENDYALCVFTDDDLRYVFTVYGLEDTFKDMTMDILDVDRFFEDWEEYYGKRLCNHRNLV